MKKIFIIAALLFLGTVPSGLLLKSMAGTVPNKPRYISIASSTTEILFALGLADEIVGVSSYCDYPSEAKSKAKVGTFSSPNIEKIISLRPDIIFCTGLEQAAAVRQLRQLNLRVFVSDPANFAELFKSIEDIGGLTRRQKEARVLIRKMKSDIEKTELAVMTAPLEKRPKVFVEIWGEPLMTAGKGSFIDELLTLAGGINIACDTKRPYSYFSAEQVIKRDPDCIILGYMQKGAAAEMINKRFGWKDISAVKNNRIYNDINPDLFLRPGPRLTEGLEEIHKRLYTCLPAERIK